MVEPGPGLGALRDPGEGAAAHGALSHIPGDPPFHPEHQGTPGFRKK